MSDVAEECRKAIGDDDVAGKNLALRRAYDEIGRLRLALRRYGDHFRMGTVEPMGLQQTIDDAMTYDHDCGRHRNKVGLCAVCGAPFVPV